MDVSVNHGESGNAKESVTADVRRRGGFKGRTRYGRAVRQRQLRKTRRLEQTGSV